MCVIEADSLQLRVIIVGLYLFLSCSLLCQILAVFAVDVYSPFWFLVPRFLSPAFLDSIHEPCCFLDSNRRTLAAHCFPALPASALRKAPLLPTESSASAYGKLCLCLRRAPPTVSRQQRSYGSTGREYAEHRTSGAGVSSAGVRAHYPSATIKIARCATHTAEFPHHREQQPSARA